MILGIDAHKLDTAEPTGTDKVTQHLILNLDHDLASKFDKIVLYTKKPISKKYSESLPNNVVNTVISLPYLWSSVGLSSKMYFDPPDILFVPSHSLPFILPKKNVCTIHDIGFHEYPNNYSKKQYLHLINTTKHNIKKSDIIITPSQFVKKTLINKYYADPNKIHVVHLGIDASKYSSKISAEQASTVFKQYDDRISKYPYLFYVGRLDTRKNITNIIKSFEIFKDKYKEPHILVLAGKAGEGYATIESAINSSKHKDSIVVTDYISDEHLSVFLAEAEIFIFPTLYEGFGLPILEAQACKTPVITSNISAMPEIAGDGALLVDPHNCIDIAQNIRHILGNNILKEKLIDRGSENVKKYSWKKFADQILEELITLSKKI